MESAFYLSLLSYFCFLQWHLPVESIPKQQLSQWCLSRKRMKGFKILLLPGGSKSAMQETWVWSLGVEDSPGEGNGNPLQYSCLENPMDRGAWWATVHGVTKSWKQLSLSVSGLHPYCQRASLTMWIRDPSAWYLHLSWLLSQISFFVVFTGSSIVAHLHLEGGRSDWTDELSEWWIQYS